MALVAYGASDDSDLSEDDEAPPQTTTKLATKTDISNGHISDEEEFFGEQHDDSILEPQEPDLFSLIAKKLPQALKAKKIEVVEEDLETIPGKKDYGQKMEEPPAKKAKRAGPVKITIPSLAKLGEEEEEEEREVRVKPSSTGGRSAVDM